MIEGVYTPASHFVIAKPVIEDLTALGRGDHDVHPKNEQDEEASP
jgi:hypothetical protein